METALQGDKIDRRKGAHGSSGIAGDLQTTKQEKNGGEITQVASIKMVQL